MLVDVNRLEEVHQIPLQLLPIKGDQRLEVVLLLKQPGHLRLVLKKVKLI